MKRERRQLPRAIERLESRSLLAGDTLTVGEAVEELAAEYGEPTVTPMLLSGVASSDPKQDDSPALRVDPNLANSPYAGVGALEIFPLAPSTASLCSASVIGQKYILTAAHCFDLNGDGDVDSGIDGRFVLNVGRNRSHVIPIAKDDNGVSQIFVHKDFDGLNVNSHDDIAVVQLNKAQMEGNPDTFPDPYKLRKKPLTVGQKLTLVGYGQSGFANDATYTVPASATVKRVGKNVVDFLTSDQLDEGTTASEVYGFDFDQPFSGIPKSQGGSLGNKVETQLGPGDSGGPAFVGQNLVIGGINSGTILFSGGFFPSVGFGTDISSYVADIKAVMKGDPSDFVLAGSAAASLSAQPFLAVAGVSDTLLAAASPPVDSPSQAADIGAALEVPPAIPTPDAPLPARRESAFDPDDIDDLFADEEDLVGAATLS
jgi:hypothetical protein